MFLVDSRWVTATLDTCYPQWERGGELASTSTGLDVCPERCMLTSPHVVSCCAWKDAVQQVRSVGAVALLGVELDSWLGQRQWHEWQRKLEVARRGSRRLECRCATVIKGVSRGVSKVARGCGSVHSAG